MEYDFALILWAAYVAVFIVILGRIILRPQREPASRLAWLIATIAVPVVGILAYLLLGEARISAKRRARYAAIEAHLPHPHDNAGVRRALARSPWAAPFALAETVNALPPTAGNRAHLAADSNAAITKGIVALVLAAVQDKPATEVAAMDIAAALAPFDLTRQLSSNRTQGVPNMIALVQDTARRIAGA